MKTETMKFAILQLFTDVFMLFWGFRVLKMRNSYHIFISEF